MHQNQIIHMTFKVSRCKYIYFAWQYSYEPKVEFARSTPAVYYNAMSNTEKYTEKEKNKIPNDMFKKLCTYFLLYMLHIYHLICYAFRNQSFPSSLPTTNGEDSDVTETTIFAVASSHVQSMGTHHIPDSESC